MKTGIIAVMIFFLVLVGRGSGMAQEHDNSAMKSKADVKMASEISTGVKPEISKPRFWRSFKKPNDAILKKMLTSLQYEVTQ